MSKKKPPKCKHSYVQGPGSGKHYASIRCVKCNLFYWISKWDAEAKAYKNKNWQPKSQRR